MKKIALMFTVALLALAVAGCTTTEILPVGAPDGYDAERHPDADAPHGDAGADVVDRGLLRIPQGRHPASARKHGTAGRV